MFPGKAGEKATAPTSSLNSRRPPYLRLARLQASSVRAHDLTSLEYALTQKRGEGVGPYVSTSTLAFSRVNASPARSSSGVQWDASTAFYFLGDGRRARG